MRIGRRVVEWAGGVRWKAAVEEGMMAAVHVEKERVENGEFVARSGVLGALLGHDFKERAVDPNPRSSRWTMAFLSVGALKRRSVRLEVRKPVFIPDEALAREESKRLPSPEPKSSLPLNIDGVPIAEFMTYIDQRLAETEQTRHDAVVVEDPGLEEATGLPIEIGTVPYNLGALGEEEALRRMAFDWIPAGKRRRIHGKGQSYWRREWEHMWSGVAHNRRAVPSSLRRFFTRTSSRPYRSLYYVEDTVVPDKMTVPGLSNAILEYLKTLPSYNFAPNAETSDRGPRNNTLWPRRREGSELWNFIARLSDDIRNDRFRFDWETAQYFEGRLYNRALRRRGQAKGSPAPQRTSVHMFGAYPPIKDRYRRELRSAKFRIKEDDTDDEDGTESA